MIGWLKNLFGSKYEKDVKNILPIVEEINGFYSGLSALSDDDLKGKTVEFRERIHAALKSLEQERTELKEKLNADLPPAEREKLHGEQDAVEEEIDQVLRETLDGILDAYSLVASAFSSRAPTALRSSSYGRDSRHQLNPS